MVDQAVSEVVEQAVAMAGAEVAAATAEEVATTAAAVAAAHLMLARSKPRPYARVADLAR